MKSYRIVLMLLFLSSLTFGQGKRPYRFWEFSSPRYLLVLDK